MQLKVAQSPSSFISDCIRGVALLEDADDYIDRWHEGDTGQTLHEFLGMTRQEYNAYLLDDSALAFIVKAHREQVPFKQIAEQDYSYALAARSQGGEKILQLMQWLKQEGLLS
ncbi:hypothetical protein [Hymenobacter sp. PAMC 26628]|uniref:hypothetical protein n=1 Tax=Hymenobacter sp. PAMC 26628 TaxID=1484118 RepID=UPI0007700790|nr:hypothetical protein [Hymenobacter sp. PAMC 26628]AMJ67175.1 hypothetical protein AXW84_18390 [Hymenobacter sp. PAMC 26628]